MSSRRRPLPSKGFTIRTRQSRTRFAQDKEGRTVRTYQDIALTNLINYLRPHLDISTINTYEAVLRNSTDLRFLNMKVLGQMLIFVTPIMPPLEVLEDETATIQFIQDNFTFVNLKPYIDELDTNENDREVITLRYMATFIRYFVLYTSLRLLISESEIQQFVTFAEQPYEEE